jgi:hypothetical protein
VVESEPLLEERVDTDLIGSAELEDGRLNVTFNGMALYHYAFDNEPGDMNDQGLGNNWFVVLPACESVREEVQTEESAQPQTPIL